MEAGKRIGIIGGGIAGLTAAYRLAQAGHRVTVFESRPTLGGQAATFPVEGARLEIFYHHIFTSDLHVINLMEELGLASQLQWLDSRMGYFQGGRVYDFVTPFDLLRFTPIPLIDRLRCGLLTLYLQKTTNGLKFERFTASEWLRRAVGERAYKVVFEPPLRGKFGDHYHEVSMTWFWGKVHLRAGSRRAGLFKEVLGYPRGSFQILIDALADGIRRLGGAIYTSTPVQRVILDEGRAIGLQIEPGDRAQKEDAQELSAGAVPFDKIIATVPSPIFLSIAPDLPEPYAAKLRWVRYQTALCLVLKMRQPLSRIYWLNISDPQVRFVAAIEHTNYIPPAVYGGYHLLYLSNYLERNDPLCSMSKEELLAAYTSSVQRINPRFSADWVEESWLFRDEAGQPIVTCDYREHIPEQRTPIPNLYLANTTQIYPEDRGINYSVRLGQQVAALVQSDIQQSY